LKTILITGASGFIGKHLCALLYSAAYNTQFKLVALSSVSVPGIPTVLHNDYTFSKENFIKLGVTKIDLVIHVGAFIPKVSSDSNNIEACNLNIDRTKYLLDNIFESPQKFVFLSTVDVYTLTDKVIDESTQTQPVSLYGWSKLYCEKLLTSWGEQNKVEIQILRVGHVYGPGEEAYGKIIPAVFKKIKRNENIEIWGTGKEKRAFIYVDDLVKAIANSIPLVKPLGVVNLVSDQSIAIADLVQKMISITGSQSKIVYKTNTAPPRDLIFNNSLMKSALLKEETPLAEGLLTEWQYTQRLSE
jgi:nucleoside-diphosphate-sugar epimerase